MLLNNEVLSEVNCTIYKYNYTKNSFQIRNYFKTNTIKLIEEYESIIKVLIKNKIRFNILKDNTIEIKD